MQVGSHILHALESIDHYVVYDISPQHDVTPGRNALPLVGCAKPPGLQDILQMTVLALNRASALVSGQILEDVGTLTQLCQLLKAGKEGNRWHDADLWHLPPSAIASRDVCTGLSEGASSG